MDVQGEDASSRVRALVLRARACNNEKDHRKALALLRAAWLLNRDSPAVALERGRAYLALGYAPLAVECLALASAGGTEVGSLPS